MSHCDHLLKMAEDLFGKRAQLLSRWQDFSDNFYPEVAIFTSSRSVGAEFATHLMSSYPLMVRRDLGNQLGTMLRPTSKDWFHNRPKNNEKADTQAKQWLEWATGVQKKAMYDMHSGFTRATKEGDHMYATIGQCVISAETNAVGNTMLYRSWHPKDVAWCENENGRIDSVYRKAKHSARDLNKMFKGNIHKAIKDKLEKDPYCEVDIMHIVVPADMYEGKQFRTPFVSIYIDVANKFEMEVVGSHVLKYVIPRWMTIPGSQYAYSPASVIALPDARMLQSMTRVLLEAGEKAVNPPMIMQEGVVRGDLDIRAGGLNVVDSEYDERNGEALRTMISDKGNIPLGMEMQRDIRQMLHEAFFLNSLSLPPQGPDMTAFEVGQRVQEYIRQAMPIFEPIESDYNGGLCEMTFTIMQKAGAFGSPQDMPKSLWGQDTEFVFESPLRDATERAKGQRLIEAQQILSQAAAMDQTLLQIIDWKTAFYDTLEGIGTPAKWMNPPSVVEDAQAQAKQAMQMQSALAAMQQGATVAQTLGDVNVQGAAV